MGLEDLIIFTYMTFYWIRKLFVNTNITDFIQYISCCISTSESKFLRSISVKFCFDYPVEIFKLHINLYYIIPYIPDLVCYTNFHWFFNPECQHIFGKQTGYICTFSVSLIWAPKTITTWMTKIEIFTLH